MHTPAELRCIGLHLSDSPWRVAATSDLADPAVATPPSLDLRLPLDRLVGWTTLLHTNFTLSGSLRLICICRIFFRVLSPASLPTVHPLSSHRIGRIRCVPVVKVDQLRCASCLASAVISLLPCYRAQEILFRNPSDRMTKDPPSFA